MEARDDSRTRRLIYTRWWANAGGGRGFPLGHSATAAFGAGFVHRRYGLLPALPLYAGTGFVAWSRVESRAHRTLDVVAGIAI